MPYNRNLYSSSESAIDAGMIYDQTEEKLQSEINAEVSSDIIELDESLSTFVRPNLLDNWYFVGGGSQLGNGVFPINQKGQTSYIGNSVYGIDRWYSGSGSTGAKLTVNSDGVTLQATTSSTADFIQKLSSYAIVAGDKITLSVLLADGTFGTVTGTAQAGSGTSGTLTLGSLTAYHTQANNWVLMRVSGNSSVKIKAVKLEVGSSQTLAHQENGVWVLNEIPNFAEELTKCQREDGNFIETVPFDLSTLPVSNTYGKYIGAKDKDDYVWFYMQPVHNTAGRLSMMYAVRRLINGSPVTNGFYLGINADGSLAVTVDSPAAWRTALNTINKSGDTVTGVQRFRGSNLDKDVAADVWSDSYPVVVDKDGDFLGNVRAFTLATGVSGVQLTGQNGSYQNFLRLGETANNEHYVSVSAPGTWRTALGAVSKSGDTISGGALFVRNAASNAHQGRIVLNNPEITFNQDNTETIMGEIMFDDAATNLFKASVYGVYTTTKTCQIIMRSRNWNNGTAVLNSLALNVAANGTASVDINQPGAWRKALNLCYAVNDTYSTSAGVNLPAIVNGNSTIIYMSAHVDKSMENISTITVTSLNGWIAGPNGALNNSATSVQFVGASGYTVACTKLSNYMVRIQLTKSSAFSNSVNNSSVVFFCTLTLKFT